MARFKIISKDGSTVRYEGKPKYNGSYLKPAYLEFSEIASDFPIAWEVGDYVDYSRTGMRYRLYSVPQPSKNARRGTHGKAFTYSSVQLFSATKELEIALFRDVVSADNNIHFSSSPDVATFEDVYGIARRIEACMNDLYPGRWEIRVADFDEERDAEVIEKVNTAKDFFMSGGTCLDALSKIYELWQDIGWFHTEENGKEIITIGYSNRRIDENTASGYLYGKGNGLRAIKKNQTNREEFATRLYVYGSERNIPSRYYNSQDILNAESVDIRNLMIPKGEWGLTDGKRDARKAYLENAEAVQKYGIIPKVHYFDSDEAGADIYPSIGGMTIGRIRKALDDIGQTDYYPSYDRYPDDAERVDEILSVENPQDDGMIYKNGKKYLSSYESITSEWSIKANTDVLVSSCVFDLREEAGPCELSFSSDHKVTLPDKKYSVVSATITIETAPVVTRMPLAQKTVEGILENGVWHINLPDLRVKYGDVKLDTYSFYVFLYVEAGKEDASCAISSGKFSYGLTELKASEFKIRLKQIGFDISHQATIGKGCKVAVNTGACAGRDFVVTKCLSTSDGWELTAKRQQDDSLDYLFPNQDYQIAPGDRFVLIDIAMPDIYIKTAEDRLLSEGQKLLERASKIQNHYEPSIDAKVMHESGRSLREGMFMEITDEDVVDGATDYILIDTLGIYEDEDAIPTYKVTLKERRKVTYKGTPTAPSTESKSSSSDDSAGTQVDLSEYAKRVYVDDKIKAIAEELASMWTLDDDGNLVTEKQVVIKNSLIIHGDMASGGEGEDTPVEGASEVVIDGMRYPAKDGVIDLTEAFANVEVDLSEYYTKNEVNELIDEVKAGDIDLANYYTKSEVDAKIPKKLSALENDLNLGSFAYKNALAVSDIPDLSGKYLPLTGGTISNSAYGALEIKRTSSTSGYSAIKFSNSGGILGYIGMGGTGSDFPLQPTFYDGASSFGLLHSGNYSNYALPLSGGTMGANAGIGFRAYNAIDGGGGWAIDALTLYNRNQDKKMGTVSFHGGGNELYYIYIGVNAYNGNNLRIYPGSVRFGDNHILHSGNVGSYKSGDSDKLGGLSASSYVATKTITGDLNATDLYASQSLILSLNSSAQNVPSGMNSGEGIYIAGYDTGFMLLSSYTQDKLMYRRGTNSLGSNTILSNAWKTIAFTDSNVASAQALKHSNGTVGATAESSGIVSFASHIVPNNDSQAYVGVANKAWYAVYTNGLWAPSGKTLYLGANNSNHIIVNTSGNVTIGGSDLAGTSAKLYVNGKVYAVEYSSLQNNKRWIFGAGVITGNENHFVFSDATSYKAHMIIDSVNSYVGIGTTSPAYKLDVAGTGRFTGKVSASGGIDIPNGQQLAFLDASGNRHTIAWDSASNGILIDGNLIVLGELATGLPMQEIPSIPEIGV